MSVSKVRVRTGLRGHVTREWDKVKAIVQDPTPVTNAELLRRSMSKMKDYRLQIESMNMDIFAEVGPEKLEAEMTSTQSYNDDLMDDIEQIQSRLNEAEKAERAAQAFATAQAVAAAAPAAVVGAPQAHIRPSINLPKLQMMKFSGDITQWMPFWDFYKTAIHENAALKDVEKFNYLMSTCLAGEAFDLASGSSLTENNYAEVIARLQERYGNPQRARFAHFDALFEMKTAKEDLTDLQRVYDDCEKHIRSLKVLGSDGDWEDVTNEMFVRLILNKLSSEVQTDLCRRTGAEDWTLEKLRENLKIEITARDMGKEAHGTAQFGSVSPSRPPRTFQKPASSASTLAAHSQNIRPEPYCKFCKSNNHFSDECEDYPDVKSRRGVISDACLTCLSRHSGECRQQERKCYHCWEKGHHRSICPVQFAPGSDESDSDAEMVNVAVDQKKKKRITLMQTAKVTIQDNSGKKKANARILMDIASSNSYITEEACRRLGIPLPSAKENVTVAIFGSQKKTVMPRGTVKFKVECQADSSLQEIEAVVIPTICSPIARVPIDPKKYYDINHLKLAEPQAKAPDKLPVDILIGNDQYYMFCNQTGLRGPDPCWEGKKEQGGPVFVDSRLGFLTAGTVTVDPGWQNFEEVTLIAPEVPFVRVSGSGAQKNAVRPYPRAAKGCPPLGFRNHGSFHQKGKVNAVGLTAGPQKYDRFGRPACQSNRSVGTASPDPQDSRRFKNGCSATDYVRRLQETLRRKNYGKY